MECKRYDTYGNDISVFFLTDIHEGNSCSDSSSFLKAVKYINDARKDHDEIVVIGGGDYIDAINPKDKRFNPSEIESRYGIRDLKDLPRKQMKQFHENIKPIEDLFKFALVGNHEETYIRDGHYDVYDYLCSDLLPDCKKIGYLGLVQIKMNKNKNSNNTGRNINYFVTHGTGGGGYREGYNINNIYDLTRFYDADYYLMGHVHHLYDDRASYYYQSNEGKLCCDTRLYGVGGTFLKTIVEGKKNYFEGRKGKMSDIGFLECNMKFINGTEVKKSIIKHFVG